MNDELKIIENLRKRLEEKIKNEKNNQSKKLDNEEQINLDNQCQQKEQNIELKADPTQETIENNEKDNIIKVMIDKNNIYENEIKKEGNETLICKEKNESEEKENQNIIETQQSDLIISEENINLDKKAQKKNKSIELKEQQK